MTLTGLGVQGTPLQTPSEQCFRNVHLESPWYTQRDAGTVGENIRHSAHFTIEMESLPDHGGSHL
jgi:hypothetical protein